MKTREQKMLDRARFTAKYEMPFWSKVQSIADKYHLSSIRDYAEIKWREKTGGSLTLISTALNIKESKLNKEASS
jgi:hypothetical protein